MEGKKKGLLIFFAVVLVLILGVFFYYFGDFFLTGRAINVVDPNQGEILQGSFSFSPAEIGVIPEDSLVRVDIESGAGSSEKTYSLSDLVSDSYKANYLESVEFAPAIEIIVSYHSTISSLTAPLPSDLFFQLKKDVDDPVLFEVSSSFVPFVKEVRLRGQVIDNSAAFLVKVDSNHYTIESVYGEDVSGFPQDSPILILPFSPFDLTISGDATVSVELSYEGDKLSSESKVINVEDNPGPPEQPIVDYDPETSTDITPDFSDSSVCKEYTCETFSTTCDIPAFSQISQGLPLASNVRTARCWYTEEGCTDRSFLLSMRCGEEQDANVIIVNEREGVGSENILTKYSSSGISSNAKIASVFDEDIKQPVAHVIYDEVLSAPSLDLVFVQSNYEEASHCTDGVVDEDEAGLDCGGTDCKACVEESLNYSLIFIWISTAISLLVVLVSYRNFMLRARL